MKFEYKNKKVRKLSCGCGTDNFMIYVEVTDKLPAHICQICNKCNNIVEYVVDDAFFAGKRLVKS